MLIFSQFIIYFNEKPVLTRLMSILKLQGALYPDIKETVLKNAIELSKHYSIRQTFLNKKLLSKFTKAIMKQICK
jgi:hypothetical protein